MAPWGPILLLLLAIGGVAVGLDALAEGSSLSTPPNAKVDPPSLARDLGDGLLRDAMEQVDPQDLAEALSHVDPSALADAADALDPETMARLLEGLEPADLEAVMAGWSKEDLRSALEELDADQWRRIVDRLEGLDPEGWQDALSNLEEPEMTEFLDGLEVDDLRAAAHGLDADVLRAGLMDAYRERRAESRPEPSATEEPNGDPEGDLQAGSHTQAPPLTASGGSGGSAVASSATGPSGGSTRLDYADRDGTGDGSTCHALYDPFLANHKRTFVADMVDAAYGFSSPQAPLHRVQVGPASSEPAGDAFTGTLPVHLDGVRPTPLHGVAAGQQVVGFTVAPPAPVELWSTPTGMLVATGPAGTYHITIDLVAPATYSAGIPPGVGFHALRANGAPSVPPSVNETVFSWLVSEGYRDAPSLSAALVDLAAFFSGFGEGQIDPGEEDFFQALVDSQVGCCRHRAVGFVVAAQVLGVPARLVANECHAFAEVQLPGHAWARVDLGGCGRAQLAGAENSTAFPSSVADMERVLGGPLPAAIRTQQPPDPPAPAQDDDQPAPSPPSNPDAPEMDSEPVPEPSPQPPQDDSASEQAPNVADASTIGTETTIVRYDIRGEIIDATGEVRSDDGTGLAGVDVAIRDGTGEIIAFTQTDEEGVFEATFDRPKEGFRAEHPGSEIDGTTYAPSRTARLADASSDSLAWMVPLGLMAAAALAALVWGGRAWINAVAAGLVLHVDADGRPAGVPLSMQAGATVKGHIHATRHGKAVRGRVVLRTPHGRVAASLPGALVLGPFAADAHTQSLRARVWMRGAPWPIRTRLDARVGAWSDHLAADYGAIVTAAMPPSSHDGTAQTARATLKEIGHARPEMQARLTELTDRYESIIYGERPATEADWIAWHQAAADLRGQP